MTAAQTSPTPSTVQARAKRGKLKPPECRTGRLNYRAIVKKLKGKSAGTAICDPTVDGPALAALRQERHRR